MILVVVMVEGYYKCYLNEMDMFVDPVILQCFYW